MIAPQPLALALDEGEVADLRHRHGVGTDAIRRTVVAGRSPVPSSGVLSACNLLPGRGGEQFLDTGANRGAISAQPYQRLAV
jgi:hypothetical protein